ncbi:hypothetical protein Unana1_04306 [Umbelopsis nana]
MIIKPHYANSHNSTHHSRRAGRHDKKGRADDSFAFSGFEDSNNSQYDGMDNATGPRFDSSETSETPSTNSSENEVVLKKGLSNRNPRKRAREEDTLFCSDKTSTLDTDPPATSELFEVRYFSMPQHKKRELESYLREFATHVKYLDVGTLSGIMGNN